MFAIVKLGVIEETARTVQQLFPNTSFPGGPDTEFLRKNEVFDVLNGERKDDQYYFVTQGDITVVDGVPIQQYTSTAKEMSDSTVTDSDGNEVTTYGLKSNKTDQVKQTANSSLARTDWMVIRKAERDVAIPDATATYRAAVITECARLEAAIAGAADVDALAVVMNAQNWPKES